MGRIFAPFGDEDWRECVEQDLTQLGAEEAVRGFGQAESVLSGLMQAAEPIGVCLYLALSSAQTLAQDAREQAEVYTRKRT
jgi:hypothetical protein